MKTDIHPEYFKDSVTKCACGAEFTLGSTEKSLSVELCSKCHPFNTGKQKIIDSARRVEKFEARIQQKSSALDHKAKAEKKAKRAAAKAAKKLKESEA